MLHQFTVVSSFESTLTPAAPEDELPFDLTEQERQEYAQISEYFRFRKDEVVRARASRDVFEFELPHNYPTVSQESRDALSEPSAQVRAIFDRYAAEAPDSYRGQTPYALSVHGPFFRCWHGFASWANQQGLRASWRDSALPDGNRTLCLRIEPLED